MLPEWLQHATRLLERSFHDADYKIKQKDQPARVSDYRYYLVSLPPFEIFLPRLSASISSASTDVELTLFRFIADECMSMPRTTRASDKVLLTFVWYLNDS